MKKSRRYSRRSRFLVPAALLAAVVVICILFGSFRSKAGSSSNPDTGRVKFYTSVYIEEGDTLWSIAEEYMSEEYGSIDRYVNELKQLNHVSDRIRAGCYLTVSYYAEPGQ